MAAEFLEKLILLSCLAFAYLLVRHLVDGIKQIRPRNEIYNHVQRFPSFPTTPSPTTPIKPTPTKSTRNLRPCSPQTLRSLTSLDLQCLHPEPYSEGHSCAQYVKAEDRMKVVKILEEITLLDFKGNVPVGLLFELASRHFCTRHKPLENSELPAAFVEKWSKEWRSSSFDFSINPAAVEELADSQPIQHDFPDDIHQIPLIPGAFVHDTVDPHVSGGHDRSHPASSPGRGRPPENNTPQATRQRARRGSAANASLPNVPPPSLIDQDSMAKISEQWYVKAVKRGHPDSLHCEIFKELKGLQKLTGSIYVLQKRGCEGYYKVGWTVDVQKRLHEHRSNCSVDWVHVWNSRTDLQFAKRVEGLIHLDFQLRGRRVEETCWKNQRLIVDRSRCYKVHGEIVKGEMNTILQTVEHWCNWMATHRPYDDEGKLKSKFVNYALEHRPLDAENDVFEGDFSPRSLEKTHGDRRASPATPRSRGSSSKESTPTRSPRRSPRITARKSNKPGNAATSGERNRPASRANRQHVGTDHPSLQHGSPRTTLSARQPTLSPPPSDIGDLPTITRKSSEELWECTTCGMQNGCKVPICEVCDARAVIDKQGYIALPAAPVLTFNASGKLVLRWSAFQPVRGEAARAWKV